MAIWSHGHMGHPRQSPPEPRQSNNRRIANWSKREAVECLHRYTQAEPLLTPRRSRQCSALTPIGDHAGEAGKTYLHPDAWRAPPTGDRGARAPRRDPHTLGSRPAGSITRTTHERRSKRSTEVPQYRKYMCRPNSTPLQEDMHTEVSRSTEFHALHYGGSAPAGTAWAASVRRQVVARFGRTAGVDPGVHLPDREPTFFPGGEWQGVTTKVVSGPNTLFFLLTPLARRQVRHTGSC